MIFFENISKIYKPDTVALKNVSFQIAINENEFVSIVGKSGAGKTTLIKLLLREEEPTDGKIIYGGKNIAEIKNKELPLFRQKIGCVFQDYRLLPNKTVFENVAYAMELMGATDYAVSYTHLTLPTNREV